MEAEQKPITKTVEISTRENWMIQAQKGELVFEAQCKSCHKKLPIGMCRSWGDPFYMGEETFINFVISSTDLRESGDLWAIGLKEDMGNQAYEHEFGKHLSKQEITDLMVYIKNITIH